MNQHIGLRWKEHEFTLQFLKDYKNVKNLIPPHQFGFRNKYATIGQVCRLTNKIYSALEQKKYCTAYFISNYMIKSVEEENIYARLGKIYDKAWKSPKRLSK